MLTYKVEKLTDVSGTRWWVTCWAKNTPFYSLGASETRPWPVTPDALEIAKGEARAQGGFANMAGDNRERFRAAYEAALVKAIEKNPGDYMSTADEVPVLVEKMMASAAHKNANLGPALKAAARAVGIKPTMTAIAEFLNGGS
jgi:hypothetical protein